MQTLTDLNFKIQIATNGLLYRKILQAVKVVCSPKNLGSRYKMIREDLIDHVIAVKFLVSETNPLYNDITHIWDSSRTGKYIYSIMHTPANRKLAMRLAIKHNAILSVQLHKILGIE